MSMNPVALIGALAFALGSAGSFAAESHIAEAVSHAETASKAADARAVVEHAELAIKHARTADEHLDAAIKNLETTIEHGKVGHTDIANKSAADAVTHLKGAR